MTPTSLRIVFFGTPQFAVPTLQHLLASRHQVVAVVTQPDRPRGRGHMVSDAPVKETALAAGVTVLQPEKLRTDDFLSALVALRADLGVVAAYGKILPESVIQTPRLGMINVHASLLPRYRGAAPIHRAVIAGEPVTGVTIMRVVKALDAGAMLATVSRQIDANETSVDVERDLATLGAELLVATVDRLAAGPVEEVAQDDAASTYAARLTKDDGVIDWSRSAVDIHNQIRGLHPWPLAFAYLRGHRVILRRSRALDGIGDAAPGTIVKADTDLHVATGGGLLALDELQAEGKRATGAREFVSGHRLQTGEQITSRP